MSDVREPKPKNRFTFKKEPRETGLRSVGYPHQSVRIKLNGKVCGMIYAPNWQRDGWMVSVMVMVSSSENCPWSWRRCGTFKTEQYARDWVLANADKLLAMNLRYEEEED